MVHSTGPAPTTRERELPSEVEVLVVGGGLAGLSVARSLIARGIREVLVVERERICGAHSSGRNAGMVRSAIEDPVLAEFARRGRDAIRDLAASDPTVRYREVGSILLRAESHLPSSVLDHPDHERIRPAELRRDVPLLQDRSVDLDDGAIRTRRDGIVEPHSLLESFRREVLASGGRVENGLRARDPRVEGARIESVVVGGQRIRVRHVVVATGAWGVEWGSDVGVGVALEPRRRHIVATRAPEHGLPDPLPWIWDIENGLYFRRESIGLLWSACDEIVEGPGDALADRDAATLLAEKIERLVPRAVNLAAIRLWAGHRTFTPDGRFLLGPDPRVEGWHWAVGLGGHGVTTCIPIGTAVAGAIVGDRSELPKELAFRDAVLGDDRGTIRGEPVESGVRRPA